jgi:hypothetical protein
LNGDLFIRFAARGEVGDAAFLGAEWDRFAAGLFDRGSARSEFGSRAFGPRP